MTLLTHSCCVLAAFAVSQVQQYALEVPRVTNDQLARNKSLTTGHWPYIVVGAMDDWPALQKWDVKYLAKQIPNEWVDYYPENMYNLGNKPYLLPYSECHKEFLKKRNSKRRKVGGPQALGKSRYMQVRLGLSGWERLMKDTREMPSAMWTEKDWIHKCMPNPKDIDNFYRVNQWNMLLVGENDTGIFFHHDHLAASSWQAHVVGRKTWIMCPYDQTPLLSTDLHTFKPDYQRFPGYAKAKCAKVTVEPGEILYYPSYWWHQTKCLDSPTIGVTGLMVGVEDNRADLDFKVHQHFYDDVMNKCNGPREDISKRWPGAAPPISDGVCNAMKACFPLWEENFNRIDFDYDETQPYLDHTAKGIERDEAGDIQGAIRSFRAAVQFQPDLPEVWSNLAVALETLDEVGGSNHHKKEILKLRLKAEDLNTYDSNENEL